jgi:hypothetical protein
MAKVTLFYILFNTVYAWASKKIYPYSICPLSEMTEPPSIFATGVVDTGGKFAVGVVDIGGKFASSVVDTGGAPWLANISVNFRGKKNQNDPNVIGGAWGKMIHEKNLKQKISWHCPVKRIFIFQLIFLPLCKHVIVYLAS